MIKSYMVGRQRDSSISVMNGYVKNAIKQEDAEDAKYSFLIYGNVIAEKCIQHTTQNTGIFVKNVGT